MSNLADHSSSTNRWPRSFFFFSKESVRRTAPFATDSGDGDFETSPARSPFAEFDKCSFEEFKKIMLYKPAPEGDTPAEGYPSTA